MNKAANSLSSLPARPVLAPVACAGSASTQRRSDVYFKALTVKLDKERYIRLKEEGLRRDKSSQQLLVEALDSYLYL